MGNSQEIYQAYRSNPDLLSQTGGEKTDQEKKKYKKDEELIRKVQILNTTVEQLMLEVREARAQAARANKRAIIALILALMLGAGTIVETLSLISQMIR